MCDAGAQYVVAASFVCYFKLLAISFKTDKSTVE